jgi:hypothetical protein
MSVSGQDDMAHEGTVHKKEGLRKTALERKATSTEKTTVSGRQTQFDRLI